MRTRSRLFTHGRAVINRLPNWAPPLYSALWMHILDERDLDQITQNSYSNHFGSGFDTALHNQNGLWPWEEAAFAQYLAPSSKILVAGAGGGREMIALAKMGHDVVGFDTSQDLVEACLANLDQTGVAARMLWAPPGGVPQDPGTFDALVIGRGVYHHIARRARRIAFLTALHAHLKPGSYLLLGDFLTRADDPARRGSTPVERGDFVGSAFFHYFTRSEIEFELNQAAFDLSEFRPTPLEGELAHVIARSV